MSARPQFTDPWEAARVSSFMEPAERGRWKIVRFTVTEDEYHLSRALAVAEGGEHARLRVERTIPPGDYVSLQRRATPVELKDIEDGSVVDAEGLKGYIPIMSDSPAEMSEHHAAIEEGHAHVLITGLGLGCIVSALLAKPDVSHITVVEIDRDVIALTGPYYEDEPRVTIVNADALKAANVLDGPFDYAWHDIWSHISDRNLDDDGLAEHGISYATLFDAWYPKVADQDAWAYAEALEARVIRDAEWERLDAWAQRFIDGDDGARLDLLEEFHIRQQVPHLPGDEPIPDNVREFMNEHLNVRENARRQLEVRGSDTMAADIAARREASIKEDPMARPNEVPEANVA